MRFYDLNLVLKGSQDNTELGFVSDIITEFPDAIHSADKEGKIVFANKQAVRLYGYSLSELLGKSIYDLYTNTQKTKEVFAKLQESGEIQTVARIKTKKGQLVYLKVKSFALFTKEGEFVRTFSILRDTTEQSETKRRLLQANHFSEMGRFSACLAHDIRGPLTIIKGFNDYILESPVYNNDRQLLATMDLVKRAVTKIENFTTKLLHFPGMRAEEKLQEVNLATVINESLEMSYTKIRDYNITVDSVLPNTCLLQGYRDQLEQVFSNIIANACDAVKGMPERKLKIRIAEDDKQIITSVADTGAGIKEKLQDKIFDYFFTTKGDQQGVGIGLSIANEIAISHNGRITVEKNIPCGTVFSVSLPRLQRLRKAS